MERLSVGADKYDFYGFFSIVPSWLRMYAGVEQIYEQQ